MRKLFSDTAGYATYNSSFQIKRFMEHPISKWKFNRVPTSSMCFANETCMHTAKCRLTTCKYAELPNSSYKHILTNFSVVYIFAVCMAEQNLTFYVEKKKLKYSFKTNWKKVLIIWLNHQLNYLLFAIEDVTYMLHLNLFFLMKDQQLRVESRVCTQVLSVDSVITSLSLVRLPLS